ncbi:isoleucine--tRNA ligase [Verrucomicrobiota bacterium sgz303538]
MSQNYKDTLLLPKTDFPMKADLVTREPQRLAKWEAASLYRQILEKRKEAERFVLHDGPPFANGDVHMGTALNKVLKDLIVKSKSMAGFQAPFVPGWDCHGLPIEFKVVKESRGLSPAEIRRRSEEYARKYIDIQRGQFKRLGVLGEWENPYLTLDPGYEAEIIRAFAVFVKKGLIYQSKKPVYWSTGAQTALAEAEVEYADREDPAIFVKFPVVTGPLAGQASMVIWTTTPWTLPANVAIAVHSKQEYVVSNFKKDGGETIERFVVAKPLMEAFTQATGYQSVNAAQSVTGSELAGSEAQHPFLDRKSRIITAEFVTMESGTGQVHIAPGHGADDYLAGVENGLPILSPVDEHGRFTEEVGMPAWTGKYVFEANKEVIDHLRGNGSLLAEQIYQHSYPHCWRSKTPVVFRAVEQFFIKVDKLRGKALEEIDNVEWLPRWGRNRIYGTVESRPDWCISRQRSWGVPLPAFYDAKGTPILDPALIRKAADLFQQHGTNLWFEKDDAWWAEQLGLPAGTTRRNDTIDVWIDSGVSHEAVLKHHPELQWPADVYIEATDQHRGWFQSSLMTSIALNEKAPYRTVITHGFVVDKDTRKKVSKSEQGTYVKPMNAEHFVGKYGADIVRLWAASVEFTHEVPFSEESFKVLTEAYRQFRNILRILLANLFDFKPVNASLKGATTIDHWMLSRLEDVIGTCRAAYAEYDFRKVFQTLNQFVTVDVSALYVDITKDRMYCDAADSPRRRATQTVMYSVFDSLCRLLAPVLAFTADEAWEFFGKTTSVHLEEFPRVQQGVRNEALEQEVQEWLRLRGIIAQQAVEPARQQKLIGNALEAAVTLEIADPKTLESLKGREGELEEFFILSDLTLASGPDTRASLVRTEQQRCARCWRHRRSVGLSPTHPELCDRCTDVVATQPA